MSINTLYKFLLVSGAVQTNQITDEQYTDVGADIFQLGTVKRAFLGGTDMVIRTAASGGGDLLIEGVDYEIVNEDFDYTEEAGAHIYTGIQILTVAYQSGNLFLTYKTIGSYTDPDVFNDIVERVSEYIFIGDIKNTLKTIALSESEPWWNLANPSQNLDASNFIDYVPFLRGIQAHTKWSSAVLTGTVTLAGTTLTGNGTNFDPEIDVGDLVFIEKSNQFRYIATRTSDTAATVSEPGTAAAGARMWKITRKTDPADYNYDFPITSYQITAANSFSLWLNESSTTKLAENYILMRAMAEAYACDREYGTITLPNAIGIPAGDYQITSITLANVGTSSAVIVCSASGLTGGAKTADTSNINIYPHRITGSDTTARHYEITDAAIMNDGLYNMLGMRTRDYGQGKKYYLGNFNSANALNRYGHASGEASGVLVQSGSPGTTTDAGITSTEKSDLLNETPRIGPRTNPRSGIFNLYTYVGRYVA